MEVTNFDQLAQAITSNILKKLSFQSDFKDKSNKSCLVLAPNIGIGMNEYYSYITKHYPDYNIYVGRNKPKVSALKNESTGFKMVAIDLEDQHFSTILDNADLVLVPGLKIAQLKSLIVTDDTDDVNHVILGSLMANKPVTVLLNSNSSIYNKIKAVVKDVQLLGITVINIQSINIKESNVIPSNELITEQFVTNLGKSGLKELVLSNNQLITPLAKDRLRALRIEVRYIKEAN